MERFLGDNSRIVLSNNLFSSCHYFASLRYKQIRSDTKHTKRPRWRDFLKDCSVFSDRDEPKGNVSESVSELVRERESFRDTPN